MLQQEKPDDYVVATEQTHKVREFVERVLVEIDPRYFCPTEVDLLLGNPEKAKQELGWEPKVTFKELVRVMVQADIAEVRRDVFCQNEGFHVSQYYE